MKRPIRLLLISATLVCVFCRVTETAWAGDDSAFAKANQDYADGRFQNAVDGYQSLVKSGQWSANLFYDLGNAWFRLSNFGEAILNYERALALDPHHPEAGANLALVRDEARALELRKTNVERYIGSLTPTQYAITASIAFWYLLFAIVRLFFARRRSIVLVSFIVFAGLIFAGTIYALYTVETGTKGRSLAIVTGRKIEARLATADNSNSVLALPPGSEIKILSRRGDWLYAQLPNDLRGWIPASAAERVWM